MDGSHSKDGIPLEPEGNRRLKQYIAVRPRQPLFRFEID